MIKTSLASALLLLLLSFRGIAADPPPIEVAFYALPSAVIACGESAELEWQVTGASEVWVETDSGWAKVDPVGKCWVTPKASREYALVAWNDSSVVMYELWILVE